ncbi:hypothetical protein SBBP1_730050 [Burkholderiales bacterium]|nr:hypothetical protein SBBP1_730050 [Burkholderiales bacterium]
MAGVGLCHCCGQGIARVLSSFFCKQLIYWMFLAFPGLAKQ